MSQITTTKQYKVQPLDDPTFLSQFETCTLSPEYFDHLGHLRICWLYINKYGHAEAINMTCKGIKSYAESLGAKDKFHLTITASLVKIMARRINQQNVSSWNELLDKNEDLIQDALGVLYTYYSTNRLHSEQARTSLLAPDLMPIN